MEMVLSYVLSVKEQELIQWITSMDSLKLVAYAGCAEAKGISFVGAVMELVLWVDL